MSSTDNKSKKQDNVQDVILDILLYLDVLMRFLSFDLIVLTMTIKKTAVGTKNRTEIQFVVTCYRS